VDGRPNRSFKFRPRSVDGVLKKIQKGNLLSSRNSSNNRYDRLTLVWEMT